MFSSGFGDASSIGSSRDDFSRWHSASGCRHFRVFLSVRHLRHHSIGRGLATRSVSPDHVSCFPDCPVDVIGLACLVSLVAEITTSDCGSHLIFGGAMGQRVDGIGEVDPVSVTAISGVHPELRDAFDYGLTIRGSIPPIPSSTFRLTPRRIPLCCKVFDIVRGIFIYSSARVYDSNKWEQTVGQSMFLFPISETRKSSEVSPVRRPGITSELFGERTSCGRREVFRKHLPMIEPGLKIARGSFHDQRRAETGVVHSSQSIRSEIVDQSQRMLSVRPNVDVSSVSILKLQPRDSFHQSIEIPCSGQHLRLSRRSLRHRFKQADLKNVGSHRLQLSLNSFECAIGHCGALHISGNSEASIGKAAGKGHRDRSLQQKALSRTQSSNSYRVDRSAICCLHMVLPSSY